MRYRKGYKYQLMERDFVQTDIYLTDDISTHFITLTEDGLLILKQGYACDGPSGPTIDTKSSIRGAFFHDALYELMRRGLLPKYYKAKADRLAYRLWLKDGMWGWRAKAWYDGIKNFAGWAADPRNKKKIYVTP